MEGKDTADSFAGIGASEVVNTALDETAKGAAIQAGDISKRMSERGTDKFFRKDYR